MKKIIAIALSILTLFSFTACGGKGDSSSSGTQEGKFEYYPTKENKIMDRQAYEKEGIEFPAELWQTPESEAYPEMDKGDVKAYFIKSYDDNEVFVYVGLPENATAENKVPAMVLVHGATGTAFYDWVEMWTSRGYAAIAMDTEGRMPGANCSTMNPTVANSVKAKHGPTNQAFGDSAKPINQQWVYHALASVISSTSFISSFAEVDENQIGLTGVSYGSFLVCNAAVYDDRYSFVVPVYGCLANAKGKKEFGTYLKNGNGSAATVWDDESILKDNRTPFLFVNSVNDQFFAPESMSLCVEQLKYARGLYLPRFTHGHYQGGNINEVFAFADEIFHKNKALVRLNGNPREGLVTAELPEGVTIQYAQYIYTFSEDLVYGIDYVEEIAEVSGSTVYYDLNSDAKHCLVLIKDSNDLYSTTLVW